MNEFDFINQYAKKHSITDETLVLGIGDDAATLKVNDHKFWHISTDMLVENRHFFAYDSPQNIAYKSLAVNFADIASMGATPRWVLLSIALPQLNKIWLDSFFSVFHAVLEEYKVKLIGGDTTKGEVLTISITIIGESNALGLQRNNAKAGDDIWLTGKVGLSAAALFHHWNRVNLSKDEFIICEWARVHPIVKVGFMSQANILIHAAQDISDGLIQDLGHMLTASQVGAIINIENIPSMHTLRQYQYYYDWILNSGDDYEIIFTAPKKNKEDLQKIAKKKLVAIHNIGEITAGSDCVLLHNNQPFDFSKKGFDHFSD